MRSTLRACLVLLGAAVLAPIHAAELPDGVRLVPSAMRPLDFLIVSTSSDDGRYYMLPELGDGVEPAQALALEAELFALDLELNHGALFRSLPSRTHLYVAVPDRTVVKDSRGREKTFFLRYLADHCGWPEKDLRSRVSFFEVPSPVLYSRDAGKVLGYDAKGRVLISSGPADRPEYKTFIASLVRAFPDRFAVQARGAGVSAEGGDEELVRLPGGGVGFLVGHHRFLHFFGRDMDLGPDDGLDEAQIDKVRKAFSDSLFGLPVRVLPEAALRDPSVAHPDVYHLDMLTCVLTRAGILDAFVPTFGPDPTDRITGQKLDGDLLSRAQAEYDLVAADLKTLGYHVWRIPFEDHPVRTPVNVAKYLDPDSGQTVVMLGKYPRHHPADDPRTAQVRFGRVMSRFREDFERAGTTPSGTAQRRRSLDKVWTGLAEISALPSPGFVAKKKIFEDRGYRVVEVPMFATGAGGLHCLTLY